MKRYWNHIVRSTEKRVEDFLAGQVREPAKSISRLEDEDAHVPQSKIADISRRGISRPENEDASRRGISRPKDEDASRRGQDVLSMETPGVGSAANVGRLDSDIFEGKPTVYLLTDCLCLYFCEESVYFHSEELWNAIELGVGFVERWQRDDGSMDFPSCNFYSAPDTAFCFRRLYGGWELLKKYGTTEAEAVLADRYLRMLMKCAPILLFGGFHTPNHRWAVTAALLCLARIMEENPIENLDGGDRNGCGAEGETLSDASAVQDNRNDIFAGEKAYGVITPQMLRGRAAQYLAEGIDGDEDGEYAERSTGNYNAVVDKSLILAAESLAMKNCASHKGEACVLEPLRDSGHMQESLPENQEDFLGYVERNLTAMLYYFDGDDTIFTQNSTRQDQGKKLYPEQYFYLYTYMAQRTGSALFDAAAHKMIQDNQRRGDMAPDCMYFFMTHEELLNYDFKGYGYLQEYRKFFRGSGVLRVKKQNYGYSVLNHKAGFLFLKFGEFPIGLRIGEAYCDIRNFIPSQIELLEDGCTLKATAQGWYYQPFATPQGTSDWWKMDHTKRERCITSSLDTQVQIRELEDGLEITVKTDGLSGLPLRVEIDLPAGCILENETFRFYAEKGQSMFLKDGPLLITDGRTKIKLEPGFCTHYFGGHYSGEAKNTDGYSIFMNDYTPCERTFRITGLVR